MRDSIWSGRSLEELPQVSEFHPKSPLLNPRLRRVNHWRRQICNRPSLVCADSSSEILTKVENVVVPWFLVSTYEGERLSLPMIDVKFTEMHCRMVFGDCLAKAGGPIQQMTSQSFFRLWRSAGRIVAIRRSR